MIVALGARTLRERFDAKYMRCPTSGCWLWTAGLNPVSGYAMISSGTRPATMLYAHRVSYELHVGPIPAGLDIDHRCHVRRCVNPNHLRVATRRENTSNKKRRAEGKCSSRFVGVCWNKSAKRWEARAHVGGEHLYLGAFGIEEEAASAYVAAISSSTSKLSRDVPVAAK